MALYGKYRPNTFADMVGQEAPKNTLLNAIKLKRLAHAYLFCGTRGTGKTSSARILAKAINCLNITETGDPCAQCELCTLAETERLTDIIEIDAASNRGINEIRDLREKVVFAPTTGKAKIYIIDEVHMLTKEAFNALLKTLEEPPKHAYFILATTEYHKVPETIRSRCQTFFFTNISLENISNRLEYICREENFEYEKEGLNILAKRAAGGLRDAISLLEQSSNFGPITGENLRKSLGIISSDFLEKFLFSLQSCNVQEAFSLIEALQNEGRSLEEFGKDFLGYLQEIFLEYIQTKNALLPWILEVIEIFEEGLQRSKRFEIPPLALEMAIAKTMLLQKEFKSQLENISPSIEINTDKKINQKTTIHKNLSPSSEEIKDSFPTNEFPTDEFPTEEIITEELKKEEKKAQPVTAELTDEFPEIVNPFDSSAPQKTEKNIASTPPWEIEETKKIEKVDAIKNSKTEEKETSQTFSSGELHFSEIVSQWSSMCGEMKGSIKLSLLQTTPHSLENNTLFLSVESDATQSLLNTEKNRTLIQEKFSTLLKTPITIEFIKTADSSNNSDEMSVSEVENLLQF